MLTDPSTLPRHSISFTPPFHQELKDARKVMPATMGMPTISLPAGRAGAGASTTSALALAGGPNGGDGGIVARALSTPGGGPVGAGVGEAESVAAAVEGYSGNELTHVEKLEIRAAEIMEQVLGLASFCERAGASKELEVSVEAHTSKLWCACTEAGRDMDRMYRSFLEE